MNGNVGIGTWAPVATLQVGGSGNVGIGSLAPGALLDVSGGRIRDVGIGTGVPYEACFKSDGTLGYFSGAWASVCT